jgi:hypothetical protein
MAETELLPRHSVARLRHLVRSLCLPDQIQREISRSRCPRSSRLSDIGLAGGLSAA